MIEYKKIPWHNSYEISSEWDIYSNKRNRRVKLRNRVLKYWHSQACLSENWKSYNLYVHRIMAQCFMNFDIESNLCVLHKSEQLINWKLNNTVENLWIWTYKDNNSDTRNKWRCWNLWKFWQNHPKSKSVIQYSKLWEIVKKWWSTMDIERKLWIPNTNISDVCNSKRKSAWGFIWKYN